MEKNFLNAQNIVGQDELRTLEALCTTEEPPACAAACPLHLDAREFCRLITGGDFAAAFKLYQKAIPFAQLVARTCDAPCQNACRRAEIGGAVEIRLLEKAVAAAEGKPQKPPLMLPKKAKRVAIAGGGLRGMTAANDLARKGYGVTLFEKSGVLGGRVQDIPESQLPAALLAQEIEAFLKLGIQVEYGVTVPLCSPEEAAAFLLENADAAFVACESPLNDLANSQSLLVQGEEALLAGQRSGRRTEGYSIIYDVFDGRSAATTLDRLLQNVSLLAGREKEGSFETSLYTNLAGYEHSPPVGSQNASGYGAEEAKAEAARCIQCTCMECVKKCGFLKYYRGSPRRYVREVYNNLSITMGTHQANGMINTCALCGQCEAVCPNGLDLAQVFLAARQRMVQTGKMPPSTHEFALLDMEYSLSDAFFLARHQPGYDQSAHLFFPGCQLAASEPGLVEAVYRDLIGRLEGGVGLMMACCGVMAHWAGDEGALERARVLIWAEWEELGRPAVITACPSCAATFNGVLGIPAQSLFDSLPIPSKALGDTGPMVLHHACGARHDTATQHRVRQLAEAAGAELQDGGGSDDQSPCCGYGGIAYFANEEVADEITAVALSQLGGDLPVLTYCINCRDLYLAKGREARHLLELCYPGMERLNRKKPTWSERQGNRAALKQGLLAALWSEPQERSPKMKLYIDEALARKMEDGHILESEIAHAIQRAEESGDKFIDPDTGRFTSYARPGNVTFWVEYSPEGVGWHVHNAYSHRMAFILTDKLSESGAGSRE